MQSVAKRWLSEAVRHLQLIILGLGAWVAVIGLGVLTLGPLYIWLMSGLSPVAQVREGGLTVVLLWPFGAVFGGLEFVHAWMERPYGPWGVAAITLCLLILWGLALTRSRAYRHAAMVPDLKVEAGGRTRSWS
jgi:hypothetical protein